MDHKDGGLFNNVSLRTFVLVTFLSVFYLAGNFLLLGFKTDQLAIAALFNILFYLNSKTRRFILGFAIFLIYMILFDSMKAYPNYKFSPVHIRDVYMTEKHWFGIVFNHTVYTPNEYLFLTKNTVLDILSGLFYITWIPVPLSLACYFFVKNKRQMLCFLMTFFLVNIIGFIIYYLYPAAPPWFVALHGFKHIPLTVGSIAGLERFDAIIKVPVFQAIYTKSSNVFAAIPSLHSAYPVIVFYYGMKNKLGVINLVLFILMTGIWFAAVYTSHHYCIDVLAGIACAVVGIFIFELGLLRIKKFNRFLSWYEKHISPS
jgi:hypothetical protein